MKYILIVRLKETEWHPGRADMTGASDVQSVHDKDRVKSTKTFIAPESIQHFPIKFLEFDDEASAIIVETKLRELDWTTSAQNMNQKVIADISRLW